MHRYPLLHKPFPHLAISPLGNPLMDRTVKAMTMRTPKANSSPYFTKWKTTGKWKMLQTLVTTFLHHPELVFMTSKLIRSVSDGKFHLMLKFPDIDQTKGITWKQSNPVFLKGVY